MTKYEEVARLAVAHSTAFADSREKCVLFLPKLVVGFEEYLECPPGKLTYIPVSEDLSFQDESHDIRRTLPNFVQYGPDGFWFVGLRLLLGDQRSFSPFGIVTFLLGVKKVEGRFMVRSDKDFVIHEDNSEEMAAFYEWQYGEMRRFYESHPDEPPRRFGFVPR